MRRSELIERVALRHGGRLAADDVGIAVKNIVEQMSRVLARGDRIEIPALRIWVALAALVAGLSGCVSVAGMDAVRRTVTVVYSEEWPRASVAPTPRVRDRAAAACAEFDSGSEAPVLVSAERVAVDRVAYVYYCPPPRGPTAAPVPSVRT